MKKLFTILFLLTAYFVNAQYVPNSGAYQWKGGKFVNSLQPPTGTGFPITFTNAPDSNYAALYYNKQDTSFYQFNPVPKTWTKLQSNGGISVTIDSIFITSIDSLFITNSDSIFIISGNDTIFIGTGNPAMDTAYQRGDSLFGIKTGVEFLIGVTGTGTPSGGMDTAYARSDSIFGLKNNTEFFIATSSAGIDSIFITNSDSIFIINGNDTIFVGTANNGGASLQSAYDSSLRAGDNPTINAHGNDFTIDSTNSFIARAKNTFINMNETGAQMVYNPLGGDPAGNILIDDNGIHLYNGYGQPIHIGNTSLAGSHNSVVINDADTLLSPPVYIWAADGDTLKKVAYPSGSGSAISNFKTFNTIADLIATAGDSTPYARVLGYYSVNDGGGGDFIKITSSATPVNGIIIQPTGITTSRMLRIAKGYWNVKWFGAKGIGISGYKQDSAAFRNAFDYIKAIGGYNILRMPASDSPYCLAGLGLVMPSNFKLYGDGEDKTRLLNINTNFAENYLNGTGFFIGTFSTDPTHNLSRVPRYQIYDVHQDETWVRLRNIADASNFSVGELINPSGWLYNKDGDAGKTIARKFTYGLITKISNDTLYMNQAAGMDVTADDHAYALYEVANGITTASDTGFAVVFRPNAGTTTNSHLGTDHMGVNITLEGFTYNVSPYDFITGTWYDSSIIQTPGNVVSLGSGYNIRLKDLCLNAYGNFGGQYMSNWDVDNVKFQSARKIIDVGNGSNRLNVQNCTWDYWNEFHDTSSTAMFYLNNYSWGLWFNNLRVSGGFQGNHFIQIDGVHDVHFSGLVANLPNYNSPTSDIIHITTEDTIPGTYAYNNTFDQFDITTYSSRRYISYIGQPHSDFNYNGNVVFNDMTFRGAATNANPFYFSNADSIYADIIRSVNSYPLVINATTFIRNLVTAPGSGNITIQPITFDSTFITPGPFNGNTPINQGVDTTNKIATKADLRNIVSDNVVWTVDTIAAFPKCPDVNGNTYLVSATPPATYSCSGTVANPFFGHANQIATTVGTSYTFDTASIGQLLSVSNVVTQASYKLTNTGWVLVQRSLLNGGNNDGNIAVKAGNLINQPVHIIVNNKIVSTFGTDSSLTLYKLAGLSSNNFAKYTSTGKLTYDTFALLKARTPIGISNDTIYHKASGATAGSYTNSNITIDSMGHVTAASNGSGGGGGSVSSVATNNGTGITGGTITSTGTLAIDTTSTISTKANVTSVLQGYVPITRTVNGKALSANITLGLASSDFANQGTTTTVLHGNAGGNPSFGAIGLTTDVTGTLPFANGGLGFNSATNGDILYYNSGWQKLGIGSANQPLTVSAGGIPQWASYISQDSVIISAPNLGSTLSSRLIIRNPTITVSGVQYSPRILLTGHGFYTSADHEQGFTIGVIPASSAGTGPMISFRSYIDGAPQTDSFTYRGNILTVSQLTTTSKVNTSQVSGVTTMTTNANTTMNFLTPGFSGSGNAVAFDFGTSNSVVHPDFTYTALRIAPTINETSSTAGNTMFKIMPTFTSLGSGTHLLVDIGHDATSCWTLGNDGTVTQTRPTKSSGSTPSNTPGTGAGTSPTITVTGNDISGKVSITTGTSPTAGGDVVTITFATALTNTPTSIQLTQRNANAATEFTKFYIDDASISTSSFKIKNTSSGLTASTQYIFSYTVTQ